MSRSGGLRLAVVAVVAGLVPVAGCSYSLRHEWSSRPSDLAEATARSASAKPISIAIEPRAGARREFAEALATALAGCPQVRKVSVAPGVVPAVGTPESAPSLPSPKTLETWVQDRAQADYIVLLRVYEKYEGSGTNFLVCWPGLIVQAQRWHGYSYVADLVADVAVVTPKLRAASMRDAARFDLRYSGADRTFATSVGLIGFTALGLVMAPYMCTYDRDATPIFRSHVAPEYGRHLAAKVLVQIEALR